jgi:hypothetical protein
MAGTLAVESDGLGHGSEFTVTIPTTRRAAAESPEARAPQDSHSRHRVLLADDNVDFVTSLAVLLSAEGHDVASPTTARRPSRLRAASIPISRSSTSECRS